MKERENWIDVTKGILILLVVLGHIPFIAKMEGVKFQPIDIMGEYYGLYGCFYMAAFFVLTGICSNFDTNYKIFLWRNTKSLLIPSITLVVFSILITRLLWGGHSLQLECSL